MADNDTAAAGNPDAREDERSDIEQAVEARADAVARGEGGKEPSRFTDTGDRSRHLATGGDLTHGRFHPGRRAGQQPRRSA